MKHQKLYGVIILLVVWQVCAVVVNNAILPKPVSVFAVLLNTRTNQIYLHVLYSLGRIFAGISLALFVGISLGIALHTVKLLDYVLSPIVYLLSPIPKIAFLPIIMLAFGIGDASKVFIIFLIMVFQVTVALRDTMKNLPVEYITQFNIIGAKFFDKLIHIYLPSALPQIFTSIRIGLATSFSVLFFAESFGTRYGMGYYVMNSWTMFKYVDMYTGILVLGIVGLMLYWVISFIENIFISRTRSN